jgi:hypothetical protein
MTAREIRALIEQFLDEAGWVFSRRVSLLLDELIIREESRR